MLGVASLEACPSRSRSTASRSSPSTPIPCRPAGIPVSNPGLSASGETASVVRAPVLLHREDESASALADEARGGLHGVQRVRGHDLAVQVDPADISSDGIEVEIDGATWELWFGQDGWTAAGPTYELEFPEESKSFGDSDLICRGGSGGTITRRSCPAAGHT